MIAQSASPVTPAADPVRADRLAYYLLKAVNKAIREHRMLADGDAVLVAVSGGKDSLTLLDLLRRRQITARDDVRLVVGHVRSDFYCGRAVPWSWLQGWCAAHGIEFLVDTIQIAEELRTTDLSRCFRCAWKRRKTLFDMAARAGCSKLAFAHHADDLAETMLMNLFYTARVRGMQPKVGLFGGALTVIRPLAYVEERDIVPYARVSGFPIEGEPCPEGLKSRRARIKGLLRDIESDCHDVKRHIYRAVEFAQLASRDSAAQTLSEDVQV